MSMLLHTLHFITIQIIRKMQTAKKTVCKIDQYILNFVFFARYPPCGARHLISVLKHLILCRPLHNKFFASSATGSAQNLFPLQHLLCLLHLKCPENSVFVLFFNNHSLVSRYSQGFLQSLCSHFLQS